MGDEAHQHAGLATESVEVVGVDDASGLEHDVEIQFEIAREVDLGLATRCEQAPDLESAADQFGPPSIRSTTCRSVTATP